MRIKGKIIPLVTEIPPARYESFGVEVIDYVIGRVALELENTALIPSARMWGVVDDLLDIRIAIKKHHERYDIKNY